MVPMSVAGIFKEVSTISLSAIVFGDELNELNIIGVGITILGMSSYLLEGAGAKLKETGIALFTYHKYKKSVNSPAQRASKPIRLYRRDEFVCSHFTLSY
jgi:solute carrier family 35 protein C2